MASEPSCYFGGIALHAVITTNGLSSPVTTINLSKPSWSVAECVTGSGTVDDSAHVFAACDGTTPPDGLRASTSDRIQEW